MPFKNKLIEIGRLKSLLFYAVDLQKLVLQNPINLSYNIRFEDWGHFQVKVVLQLWDIESWQSELSKMFQFFNGANIQERSKSKRVFTLERTPRYRQSEIVWVSHGIATERSQLIEPGTRDVRYCCFLSFFSHASQLNGWSASTTTCEVYVQM